MGSVGRRRVLMTSPTFWPLSDGVANSAGIYAKTLKQAGFDVTVLTWRRGDLESSAVLNGINIRRLCVAGSANVLDRYRGNLAELETFVREQEYDILIVHCWQIWSTDLVLKFSRRYKPKTPTVMVSHGLSTNTLSTWSARLKYPFWRRYQKQIVPDMVRAVSKFVVLSDYADEDRFLDVKIARDLGVRYEVVPNVPGYNPVLAKKGPVTEYRQLHKQRYCLCVGAFNSKKNEMFVLDAFVRASLRNTSLVVVGYRENGYSAKLRRFADKHSVSDRVFIFSGLSQEEIFFLYEHAWVYLCGSRTECQPIVILDAMASKTPFISTPVGCVPNLPGGLTVKSPTDMAKALNSLASSEEQYRQLQTDGARAIENVFSKTKVGEKIEGVLRDLLLQEAGGKKLARMERSH